jgi:hypothetical protein
LKDGESDFTTIPYNKIADTELKQELAGTFHEPKMTFL